MSCSGVNGINLNVVLIFSNFSLINVFELSGILLLSRSFILQKYLCHRLCHDFMIIASSSTTEVMLVVSDRFLILVSLLLLKFPSNFLHRTEFSLRNTAFLASC